jgi:hypothetical protein
MEPHERVWAVLLDHVGKGRAISGRELAAAAQLSGDRELRLIIHEARTAHKLPILSMPGVGYYRPQDPAEIDECYWQLREHAIEVLLIASTLRRCGSERVRNNHGDDWIESFLEMHYKPRQAGLPGMGV